MRARTSADLSVRVSVRGRPPQSRCAARMHPSGLGTLHGFHARHVGQICLRLCTRSKRSLPAPCTSTPLCVFAANNLPATASRVMGRPRSVRPFANFTRKNSAVHPPRHVRSVHSALEWICALFRPSHRPGSVRTQRATPFQAKRSEPVEARMGSPLQSISGLT